MNSQFPQSRLCARSPPAAILNMALVNPEVHPWEFGVNTCSRWRCMRPLSHPWRDSWTPKFRRGSPVEDMQSFVGWSHTNTCGRISEFLLRSTFKKCIEQRFTIILSGFYYSISSEVAITINYTRVTGRHHYTGELGANHLSPRISDWWIIAIYPGNMVFYMICVNAIGKMGFSLENRMSKGSQWFMFIDSY